ncbi:MAG: TraB/GumN family protein [Sphingomicrobium sp.]
MPAAPLVRATPAMWQIRDADTTVYLFGTFHTLDPRLAWFDDRLRAAFDQSGELVLETIVPTNRDQIRAAGNVVTDEPVSPGGPRRAKPFLAQTQTAIDQGRASGLSVEHGADAVLRRVADAVGKPVAGLEKFEDQLGALARIPAIPPPGSAVAAPLVLSPAPITLGELLSAWKLGDMTAFSTMLSSFEAKSPVAYRMLIADRNERWGEWIVQRMDQPGTVFVAVGAGHLAGKDSVQQWLAAKGITATRVH